MSFNKHATAVVERDAAIGDGCVIGAYSRIGGAVSLGDGCSVAEMVYIDGSVRIESGARIGPHVCIVAPDRQSIQIRQGAVIGAQATIAGALSIGNNAVVHAGAVVNKNVPATAVVAGNPARIVGYGASVSSPSVGTAPEPVATFVETTVRGVKLYNLPLVEDLRGNLTFGEGGRHVPFEVKRYFMTFEVSSEEARGEHAHRRCEQFLMCAAGRVHLVADDGAAREEFLLDRPTRALYLPPMVWCVQYRFSPGAVLLVLCSEFYDPADYIRDYAEFAALARDRRPDS